MAEAAVQGVNCLSGVIQRFLSIVLTMMLSSPTHTYIHSTAIRANIRGNLAFSILLQSTSNGVDMYDCQAAVHKALITKMNTHLKVQWCKNQ